MELVVKLYELSTLLPREEKYGLRNQIARAAISIPSNIAEGSAKNSKKDFKRFLEMALGSAFELETQLLIIQKLKYSTSIPVTPIIDSLQEEQKMINGYMKSLMTNS